MELASTLEASDLIMLSPGFGSRGVRKHYDLVWVPMPKAAGEAKRGAKRIVRHGVMVWREAVHRDPAHAWVRSLFRDWAAKTQVDRGSGISLG